MSIDRRKFIKSKGLGLTSMSLNGKGGCYFIRE